MSNPGNCGSISRKPGRPRVTLAYLDPACAESAKQILHNGCSTRVVLSRDLISVGCTDVTPEVLKYLLEQWEKNFGNRQQFVELQP